MTQLKMLSAEDKLAEIRRLYFDATRLSIQDDLAKALDLLRSMPSEEEREKATVYMEGLAEMRNDWMKPSRPKAGAGGTGRGAKRTGGRQPASRTPAAKNKKR